jgi:hypothetical protein
MPVIAHVAAPVAPVYANFVRVMPNISPVRFNLTAVRAQLRLRRALAAVATKFPRITAYVAPVTASLTPVPVNVSAIRPDLAPVCAQFMPLMPVYIALRAGRESQCGERGREYHAAKKYPFHLLCSSIKLKFQLASAASATSRRAKDLSTGRPKTFGGEQDYTSAQTPTRHLKARRPCFGGPPLLSC